MSTRDQAPIGAAAIVSADAFLPRVMLLDIGMPGMDGYQLARSLRASRRHAHALLVALTGWGAPTTASAPAPPASMCT